VDAIILFSHGSVLCGAERNLLELAARMRDSGDVVEVAFLNYTAPDFAEAVDRCVRQGAARIVVAPYFLIAGKFVKSELPEAIAAATARYPELEFIVAEPIGFHPALADAVLASAAAAVPPAAHSETLREASRWCRENPKCLLYGSDACRVKAKVAE
jgi:sirohydrochlorin ferrochelatase